MRRTEPEVCDRPEAEDLEGRQLADEVPTHASVSEVLAGSRLEEPQGSDGQGSCRCRYAPDKRRESLRRHAAGKDPWTPASEHEQGEPRQRRRGPDEGCHPEGRDPAQGGDGQSSQMPGVELVLVALTQGQDEGEEEEPEQRLLESSLGEIGSREVGDPGDNGPQNPKDRRRISECCQRRQSREQRSGEKQPGEGCRNVDSRAVRERRHQSVRPGRVAGAGYVCAGPERPHRLGLREVERKVVEDARAQL